MKHTALPFVDGKTYDLNERVQLDSGDIVKSIVPNNITNPNINMTGWDFINSFKTSDLLKSITGAVDGTVATTDEYQRGMGTGGGVYVF